MIDVDKILSTAKAEDASDVHLICGMKPILRIRRDLVDCKDTEELTPEDMNDAYDYFVRGNLDKDKVFRTTRKLDCSYEFEDIRLRVNISYANEVPVFTLRLIKKELPRYEDLVFPVTNINPCG